MLLIVLLLHLVLLINSRFTLWPEMVVYPYLMNKGFYLYRDIINPYPPIMPSVLAVFAKVFGYQPHPYQILTWIIILVIDLEIYYLSEKIFKNWLYALLSTSFFVIFSIPFGINGLWFDLVQIPLILPAFYFFYKYLKDKLKGNLFASFFIISLAFFIKQNILLLAIYFFLLTIFIFKKKSLKILKNPLLYMPFLSLLIFFLILFLTLGVIKDFIFWSFFMPLFKAGDLPGYVLFPKVKQILPILCLFIFFIPTLKKPEIKLIPLTAIVLTIFSYPRFDYFHLVPSLAIISVASAANFQHIFKLKPKFRFFPLLALLFLTVFTIRYFRNNLTTEVRFFEKDIQTAASFLRQTTPENKSIYIQNGPDQVFPLSNRLPPKPWADEFPWYLEIEGMQERVIEALKNQDTQLVIFQPYIVGGQFETGSYRPTKIADFIDANYKEIFKISETLCLKIKIKE